MPLARACEFLRVSGDRLRDLDKARGANDPPAILERSTNLHALLSTFDELRWILHQFGVELLRSPASMRQGAIYSLSSLTLGSVKPGRIDPVCMTDCMGGAAPSA